MSLSKEDRRKDKELAISLMTTELGDRAVNEVLFEIKKPPYASVYSTTWQDLEDEGLIERADTQDVEQCTLAWTGWLMGLKLAGIQNTPEFQSRVERVMGALKAVVKGRRDKCFPEVSEIAARANVTEGFVFNFIESYYAETILGRRAARWAQRGYLIEVPINYGLPVR